MNITKLQVQQVRFTRLSSMLVAVIVALMIETAQSAHQVSRPIQETGGIINQLYLYGREY